MSYKGTPVICRFCGESFTRPASLVRHLDERRCPGKLARAGLARQVAIVPAKPRVTDASSILRADIVDAAPVRSEIVRFERDAAPARRVLARSDSEPEWYSFEFPQDAKRTPWQKLKAEQREYYQSRHTAVERSKVSLPQRPDEMDSVTLWEQYHFLKAIAVRLDAGRGTQRDREMFEAGLREYNANYDRTLAKRKALPGRRFQSLLSGSSR
jgi:hypothetical protein